MQLIFQYGSNCLTERLNGPGRLNGAANDVGRAQTLNEYEIAFDVWSDSNACAAADLVPAHGTGRLAWGVLYQISADDLERLRKIEGRRYEPTCIRVLTDAREEREATTFLVKSSHRLEGLWTSAEYVGYIVKGLREHKIPEEYVQHVLDVAIRTNETARDAARAQALAIEKLRRP